MEEEINVIKKNDTWELSKLPKDHEAIGVKYVFKIKKNVKGEVERYKARLIAKGYKQYHRLIMRKFFYRLLVWRQFVFLSLQQLKQGGKFSNLMSNRPS